MNRAEQFLRREVAPQLNLDPNRPAGEIAVRYLIQAKAIDVETLLPVAFSFETSDWTRVSLASLLLRRGFKDQAERLMVWQLKQAKTLEAGMKYLSAYYEANPDWSVASTFDMRTFPREVGLPLLALRFGVETIKATALSQPTLLVKGLITREWRQFLFEKSLVQDD